MQKPVGHYNASLIEVLTLPDPNDRHVLAAAVRAKAQVIVTFNECDFPADTLAGFDLVAQHPDVFLRHLVGLQPVLVRARIEQMLQGWRKPPNAPDAFIDALERAGLPETAAALRELFAAGCVRRVVATEDISKLPDQG